MEDARSLLEEGGRRAELVKGKDHDPHHVCHRWTHAPEAHPQGNCGSGPGRGLAGKGLLCNKRGAERVAGEAIVALRGRDGVGRMGLA